jgi:hypothetical protein
MFLTTCDQLQHGTHWRSKDDQTARAMAHLDQEQQAENTHHVAQADLLADHRAKDGATQNAR